MIKFAICDDDINYMLSIQGVICKEFEQLKTFQEECQCILYSSGQELLNNFIQDEIDVFFIDIECGSMSGFDIAKQLILQKKNLGIVYITNHKHYISDAFVCRPLGFICKENITEDIRMPMINIVDFLKEKHQTLVFKKGRKEDELRVSDIISIKVYERELEVQYHVEHKAFTYLYSGQLSMYEAILLQNDFIKISRECLVNRNFIVDIQGDEVLLQYDVKQIVSRRRIEETIRKWRCGR